MRPTASSHRTTISFCFLSARGKSWPCCNPCSGSCSRRRSCTSYDESHLSAFAHHTWSNALRSLLPPLQQTSCPVPRIFVASFFTNRHQLTERLSLLHFAL